MSLVFKIIKNILNWCSNFDYLLILFYFVRVQYKCLTFLILLILSSIVFQRLNLVKVIYSTICIFKLRLRMWELLFRLWSKNRSSRIINNILRIIGY